MLILQVVGQILYSSKVGVREIKSRGVLANAAPDVIRRGAENYFIKSWGAAA